MYGQSLWTKSFSLFLNSFMTMSINMYIQQMKLCSIFRNLCIKLDSGDFIFFNIDEFNERVIMLCTAAA